MSSRFFSDASRRVFFDERSPAARILLEAKQASFLIARSSSEAQVQRTVISPAQRA